MKNKFFVNFFLAFTKITGAIPTYIFMKPKIYLEDGAKRSLPKNCILISNHKSLLDFVLYLLVFPFSTIRFLMAEVLYQKNKILTFLLNSFGGIKVDRNNRDFAFVSTSVDILNNGGKVGIFPESRLPINGKPFPFTTSAAFIALHSTAPIIPVYTNGHYGIFKRVSVCIGKPLFVADYIKSGLDEQEQLTHLTKIIENKVYELKSIMEQKAQKHHLFSFKSIPMDMARIVAGALVPVLRVKRMTPDGKKYKNKIKGGAIIAANHTSFIDPFIVGITFWYRRMHFLVAEVIMNRRLRSTLLKGAGAIKIDRNNADIEAITHSVNKLNQGYLLAVFPQGGLHRDDNIDSIKSGTALLAMRSKAPIIPMHIMPRKHWYNSRTVIIGSTIYPQNYCKKKFASTADIKNITDALIQELNRCKCANKDDIGG